AGFCYHSCVCMPVMCYVVWGCAVCEDEGGGIDAKEEKNTNYSQAYFILYTSTGCSSATTLIMNRLKFDGQKFAKCPNMIRQSGSHARGPMAPLGLDQSRGM